MRFEEMDFAALRFADRSFDVVIAAHSLLFASDQAAVLAEWLRVTRPGGRLSLSVPGPQDLTPSAIYAAIYERYGIDTRGRYPTLGPLAAVAEAAGWVDVRTDADPTTAIVLPDAAAFRRWREIGARGPASEHLSVEQHRALTEEMLAATPRTAEGGYRVPFGTLYLTARRHDR